MRHRVTHYDTLGVEPDATEHDIRAAFRRLALDHHPDRFRGDEREKAEERFQSITEAFNVLARPESRERYDRELSVLSSSPTSTGGMDPKELARRLTAKGVEELKAGHTRDALEKLKLATDHDDSSARGHYFYGFALMRTSGQERDGLRHLERAVALEPNNAIYKAEAALACLAVGMASRAARLARDTLSLDPTSEKALSVLEKIENQPDDAPQGLLDRLRKKG
jgi:curved DNA-binding protein CbpA